MLQGQRGHLSPEEGALQPGDVVVGKAGLPSQAAEIFIGEEEDEEGYPVGKEEAGPPQHQRRDEHEEHQPLRRHGKVQDEDHEEGDRRQITAGQRRDGPEAAA